MHAFMAFCFTVLCVFCMIVTKRFDMSLHVMKKQLLLTVYNCLQLMNAAETELQLDLLAVAHLLAHPQ